MITRKIKKNKNGFVLLFAVTLSAMLLAIALGVANIAFNEVKFGTNAKDTNNAFFAADTGAECALIYNRDPNKYINTLDAFIDGHDGVTIKCMGANILVSFVNGSRDKWTFDVSKLGNEGQGCAKVTVDKSTSTTDANGVVTGIVIITSNGYNNGGDSGATCSPGSNTIVRQLEVK